MLARSVVQLEAWFNRVFDTMNSPPKAWLETDKHGVPFPEDAGGLPILPNEDAYVERHIHKTYALYGGSGHNEETLSSWMQHAFEEVLERNIHFIGAKLYWRRRPQFYSENTIGSVTMRLAIRGGWPDMPFFEPLIGGSRAHELTRQGNRESQEGVPSSRHVLAVPVSTRRG